MPKPRTKYPGLLPGVPPPTAAVGLPRLEHPVQDDLAYIIQEAARRRDKFRIGN